MKFRYVILVSIIVVCVGYIIGQLIPWDLLHPTITGKDISMNDYYTRLVSIVGAIATIFATMVALFKEDIKRLYEYASLKVNFKDSNIISEVLNIESTTSNSQNIAAKKYEMIIAIQNHGKLAARGCQIYLEQINFKHSSFPAPKELKITGKPLPWIGKAESNIIIPRIAKAFVNIAEITSPESEIITVEKVLKTNGKPQIKIAGSDLVLEDFNGTYNCVFMIYCENTSPLELKLEINWNGKWQQRLSEMRDCITVKFESNHK
jgi:hypothetical protein